MGARDGATQGVILHMIYDACTNNHMLYTSSQDHKFVYIVYWHFNMEYIQKVQKNHQVDNQNQRKEKQLNAIYGINVLATYLISE